MIGVAKRVYGLLTVRERFALLALGLASVVVGAFQVVGVGSVMPVLGLLMDPNLIHENAVFRAAYEMVGFETSRGFLILVGVAALSTVVVTNTAVALTMWLAHRFAWKVQARLSGELLGRYVSMPFEEFLTRNTAELRRNILTEATRLTIGVMIPLMNLIVFGVTVVFLIGFLVWLNPVFAGLAVVVLGGGYLLIFLAVRRAMARSGTARLQAEAAKFKLVGEALEGAREIRVLGRGQTLLRRFAAPTRVHASTIASHQVLSQVPRYAIEAFAFGSVLVAVLYFLGSGSPLRTLIPVVGVYAFAGFRLLPAIQSMYHAWASVRFNQASLAPIQNDLGAPIFQKPLASSSHQTGRAAFKTEIRLEKVSFKYRGARDQTLDEITLTIPRGSFVALVGETGSGKSTIAEIILGLLPPHTGVLSVDGAPLETGEQLRKWQNGIGYVPQDIYLSNDTVEANIAFGVEKEKIDRRAVEQAARIARIHDFVVEQLPNGFDTALGDTGVRVSGGQRQRIGIARALYHDPDVLVLDEATSDLDVDTEAQVHQAILEAARTKTVIMVAHRLDTTRHCDILFHIDRGRLVAQGRFPDVVGADGRLLATSGGHGQPIRR